MSGCRFDEAYRFATGRIPSLGMMGSHERELRPMVEAVVRSPMGDEARALPLCALHAELLGRFGYLAIDDSQLLRSGGYRTASAPEQRSASPA